MIVPPATEPAHEPLPPAAPPPPPPPADRIGTWPAWVRSIDAAMLVLVLAAAFLAASHVSRNSDQWLHFATGRALLSGEYTFGSDPFSFATAGRTWVNHSWLFGTAAYLLYSADPTGFVLVAVKALLFALTFAVLFVIRRAGQPIWPWALAAAAAVVATAPHTTLRPLVVSGFFLAVTLALVFGRSWKAGTRGNLIALGVVAWLWASCDAWFILGPLTVSLTLAGEWLQRFLAGPADAAEPEGEAIPLRALVQALAVTVVASTLTPHHVRVWQLPVEMGFSLPANASSDAELLLQTLSPTDKKNYIDVAARGWNASGAAFGLLLVGGGALLALAGAFARLRVTPVLLWVAFAGLALVQYRLILPFAVVAVPLLGRAAADLIDRIRLGPVNSPRTSLLLLLASVGRIIAFPAAVIFALLAYPGWLHPKPVYPALAPRAAWGVEPDPGLKRTAELLNGWRESGKLPDDYRGLVVNFDLANHIAWFAPKEKVYANGRYAFHAPEVEKLVKARRTLLRRGTDPNDQIDAVEIANFRDTFRDDGIAYVVYSGIDSVFAPVSTTPLYALSTPSGNFSLWHVDGRSIVLGDAGAKAFRPDVFRPLAFDPVRQAFKPDLVTPLPPAPPGSRRPPTDVPFLLEYLQDPPKMPPLEALDAITWYEIGDAHSHTDYQYRVGRLAQAPDGALQMIGWPAVAGAVGNPVLASDVQTGGYRPSDISVAYNLLAFRAAWRAIAANPDAADPYLYVALTAGPGRHTLPGFRTEVKQQLQVAGFRQFLDRVAPPDAMTPRQANQAGQVAWQLSLLFQPDAASRANQVVLPEPAEQMLRVAQQYFERSQLARDEPKTAEARKKEYEARSAWLKDKIIPMNNDFQRFKNEPIDVQVRRLAERKLLVAATDKFAEAWEKESFGSQPLQLILTAVTLDVVLGRLDEADVYLREVEREVEAMQAKGTAVPEALTKETQNLRTQVWQLRGDYGKLGEALEKTAVLPALTPAERQALQRAASQPTAEQFDALTHPMVMMAVAGGLGAYGEERRGATAAESGLAKWLTASDFFVQRGMFLIFEGNIPQAKVRLEQALAPDKVPLPAYHPQRLLAEQYLRMIEAAAK